MRSINSISLLLRSIILLLVFFTISAAASAQGVEMADTMRANGKIYVVVAVAMVVLIGLLVYVFTLDRKISKLEKERKAK